MNTIEIAFSDGTTATWFVDDDAEADGMALYLTNYFGQPDSIKG